MKLRIQMSILDCVAGCIWTLSFPPYPSYLFPLFFIGFVYLFNRFDHCSHWKNALWTGFWWGFGVMWGAFYWLVHTMKSFGELPLYACLFGTSLYVAFFALQYALLGVGFFFIRERTGKFVWRSFALIVGLLTSIDLLFPEHFPWDAALSLAAHPFWLQTLDLCGTLFVCVTLYAGAVGIWMVWKARHAPRFSLKFLIPGCIGLLVMFTYGLHSKSVWKSLEPLRIIKLSGAQANIGSVDKVMATRGHVLEKIEEVVRRYSEVSRQAGVEGRDLIVWPETAFPDYLSTSTTRKAQLIELSKQLKTDFLIGSYDIGPPTERDFQALNGLFLLEYDKEQFTASYMKTVLLAFGEYVPFSKFLPSLKDTFPMVSDFAAGPGPQVIEWKRARLGLSICYEALLPGFVHRMMDDRPDLFINVTNDSWFGNTREPWFHLYLQMMRSIENRRPLFRVANTGISAYVNPYGEVVSHSPYDRELLFSSDVALYPPIETVFHHWGFHFSQAFIWIFLGVGIFRVFLQKPNLS